MTIALTMGLVIDLPTLFGGLLPPSSGGAGGGFLTGWGKSAYAQLSVTALPKTVAGGYNISCNGGNDGDLTTVVTGNVGPYTFLWSTSATTSGIDELPAGTYWVTVTDSLNNTASDTVTLIQPSVLTVSIDAHTFGGGTHISEHGAADGEMYSDVSGGIPPYTYLWMPENHTGISYKDVPAGQYSLTVTDAGGCTADADQTLTEPAEFTLDVQPIEIASGFHIVACADVDSGRALALPAGGAPPYTYTWASSESDSVAVALKSGQQRLVADDANGVRREVYFDMVPTERLYVTVTTNDLYPNGHHTTCHSCANATLTAEVTGGIAPYHYQWWKGQTNGTATLQNAGESSYQLIVADANGCYAYDSPRLSIPERDDWSVNGNSGLDINGNPKWLGTSDSTDLVIKTNGIERLKISADGQVALDSLRTNYIRTARITSLEGDSLVAIGDSSILFNHNYNRVYGSIHNSIYSDGLIGGTAVGYHSVAKGRLSIAIGANAQTTATANNAVVIGNGRNPTSIYPLVNSVPNSLVVGFNSSQATMFVGPAPDSPANTTGNVGIGNTDPSAKLDISGALRVRDYDIYLRGGTDANHGLGWYGAGRPFATTEIDGPALYGYNGGALGSVQNNAQNIALRWNSAGNVGLNTTDPQEKLHVNGNTVVTGWLSITSPGQAELFPPNNTNSTQYKLSVNGNVVAEEFTAKLDVDWYDHVFAPGYRRPTPDEKAVYFDRYRHLMGVPSESELRKNGLPMTALFGGLTRNVEENSLDIIELFGLVKELKAENKALKAELLLLQNR